jgi:hypothetical protein
VPRLEHMRSVVQVAVSAPKKEHVWAVLRDLLYLALSLNLT